MFSLRELRANLFEVNAMTSFEAYEEVVGRAAVSRAVSLGRRLRSFLALRLVHLSPAERLHALREPHVFARPKARYFGLSALLLVGFQSSPFGQGFDHPWLSLVFAAAWVPVLVALLAGGDRLAIWWGIAQRRISLPRTLVLASVLFVAPIVRIPWPPGARFRHLGQPA